MTDWDGMSDDEIQRRLDEAMARLKAVADAEEHVHLEQMAAATPDHSWPPAPNTEHPWMADKTLGVRKLSYYMPLSKGTCEACGNPLLYNMAVGVIQHEDTAVVCDAPFPKVEFTPEQEARVQAANAAAEAEDRKLRERHAWMLEHTQAPILRDLIEEHGPSGSERCPDCAACPAPPSEIDGDPVPTGWPCPVWVFVSDRMEKP